MEEHTHCSCHQNRDDHSGCGCGHERPKENKRWVLPVGVGLTVLGLVFSLLGWEQLSRIGFFCAWFLLGGPVFLQAGKNLLKGQIFDENFLMAVATVGAVAIGELPEAAGIMLFFRVGAYFEEKATEKSRRQIMEAADMRPESVTLLSGQVVPAKTVTVGQKILVRPGDRIPLDSTVVEGNSFLDTAPITGEPVPVAVQPGSSVLSGCVNLQGLLTLQVTKPLEQSMVSRILQAVAEASRGKPKIEGFITRFARWYTPTVLVLALFTGVVPPLFSGNWHYWLYTAITFLVMSCPCALVVSIPLAYFSGIGGASRQGILFKGGNVLEALAGVRAVALDKTGTLTQGTFRVLHWDSDRAFSLGAACEAGSNHPIAQSIVASARERGLSLPQVTELMEYPAEGVRATLEGKTVLCGNERLMSRFQIAVPQPEETGSVVFVAEDGVLLGRLLLADGLKQDSIAGVQELKKQGLIPYMLTGDRGENAREVAGQLGIYRVYGDLLPQEKLQVLEEIRREAGTVLFVGDGLNDAPVLSGANVGAAMGSGADAAIQAADAVFLTNRVEAIPQAVQIARTTRRIAQENVIFALGTKAIVMALGLLGYASMALAVFADTGVLVLCILNALRPLYRK